MGLLNPKGNRSGQWVVTPSFLEKVESLDLDSFEVHQQTGDHQGWTTVTKAQIRFRLRLAGLSDQQIEISGPERLTVVGENTGTLREIVSEVNRIDPLRLRQ